MNNKLRLLSLIPKYKLFRNIGYPRILPLNLTISATYHCNSRCKTCNVWKKKVNEFSFEEFDKTFKNIGVHPYWFTISGGEPFLRKDLVEICESMYDNCKPGIINIPTNGILYQKIPKAVKEISDICKDCQIIINLSLDGIKEEHDNIRNVENNYEKTINTYNALKQIENKNLEIGIHTVISKYNIDKIPDIYEYFKKYSPDSYITEIAEERVELDTINTGITPNFEDYFKVINFLSKQMNKLDTSRISKITKHFRLEYYDIVKKTLKEKRQIIPCYAGFVSGHIAPNGDVWQCCIKADPIGNLRDTNYNLSDIWFSEEANDIRKHIKNNECYCTLANASYTNMLHSLKILSKIGINMVK